MNLSVPLQRQSRDAKPFLSLVVPTYNEAGNIEALIRSLVTSLDRAFPGTYEVIVVDDDSPDRTWEIAQGLQEEFPCLIVLRRQGERGLATAVIRGWQAARGNLLGVMDGDLQHPPETLATMVAEIAGGADIAVASRYVSSGGVGSWSAVRQFLSRGAVRLALWILPEVASRLSDPMSGFFVVRREAIAGVPLSPLGYKILLEVMGRGRVRRVAEVGYTFQERADGSSKVTWRQYEEFLRHLLRLRFATGDVPVGALGRFLRFGVVGVSGIFVDYLVLYLMSLVLGFSMAASKTQLFRPEIIVGKGVAVEVAIANNFIWNDLWTFRDASQKFSGWRQRSLRFLRFNLACTLGAAINIAVFALLARLGMSLLLANLIAIAVSTAWNYSINLKFNWRAK